MIAEPGGTRVALVTGAAGGIGRAISAALSANAWTVVTTDLPGTHCALSADLTDPAAPTWLIGETLARMGRLDLLVNNAAEMFHGPLDLDDGDRWWECITVNLSAPMRLARAALSALRRDRGQILNIASVFGIRPEASYSAYCASKAGLIGLTKALAIELAPMVRVNAVAPGHVDTPQQEVDAAAAGVSRGELYANYTKTIPIGRILDPEEIGRFVAYLAGEQGFTGSCLCLDGGHLLG